MDAYRYIDEYLSTKDEQGRDRSQTSLAEELGIPGRYLSDCRIGKQKPSAEVCEGVARILVAAKVLPEELALAFQWHYSKSKGGPRLQTRRKRAVVDEESVPALTTV